jgi:peptidoglycan/xylan/chitin deacetylase (PgdA/CDA1 family)
MAAINSTAASALNSRVYTSRCVAGFLFFLILMVPSCTNEYDTYNTYYTDSNVESNSSGGVGSNSNGGVVITFDDRYVDQWFNVHNILKKYSWRATFFVTHYDMLNDEQVKKLVYLQDCGHEIGGHGLNHLDAVSYIDTHDANQYLTNEIYPMKELMANDGFYIKSFAYPYGKRNVQTDNILSDEFTVLRGTTYGNLEPVLHKCYFDNKNIIYGLGIDSSYGLDISYVLDLLGYARDNNKVIIFYSHNPVGIVTGDYQTAYERLMVICEFVNTNNMKFYTSCELEIPNN